MKIQKGSITSLASRGRISLQIPHVAISTDGDFSWVKYEDIPDEWVNCIWMKTGMPIDKNDKYFSRKSWIPHLSRKGWEANKDKIKRAYMSAGHKKEHDGKVYDCRRGTWKMFVESVEKELDGIDKGLGYYNTPGRKQLIKLWNKRYEMTKEEVKNRVGINNKYTYKQLLALEKKNKDV